MASDIQKMNKRELPYQCRINHVIGVSLQYNVRIRYSLLLIIVTRTAQRSQFYIDRNVNINKVTFHKCHNMRWSDVNLSRSILEEPTVPDKYIVGLQRLRYATVHDKE